ncbi:hypothetical protein [Kitasatospora purpeofusca]|uniref:hypothetical protein n=1 Tax=Kitasatospora purpeofusca TaxID=67352 RepID=UPI00386A8C87|nr:hypothetical protein OIP63_20285 [Kitasatospora purpeofusca]
MADNDYDPAGSTQMFRAFVDETPAPQAPGSVNTYGAAGGGRTGKVAAIAVAVLVVVGAVIWLAVK